LRDNSLAYARTAGHKWPALPSPAGVGALNLDGRAQLEGETRGRLRGRKRGVAGLAWLKNYWLVTGFVKTSA